MAVLMNRSVSAVFWDTAPEKQQLAAKMSPTCNLRPDCPPFFLMETLFDDPRTVTGFAGALANFGIPFALHLFHSGSHGNGCMTGSMRSKIIPIPPNGPNWPVTGWKIRGFVQ